MHPPKGSSVVTMRQPLLFCIICILLGLAVGFTPKGSVKNGAKVTMGPIRLIKQMVRSEARIKQDTYDYIIVGGGTAGCVLANRLSQDEGKNILMVEAGTDDYKNFQIKVPAGVLKIFKNPKFDWDFEGDKEKQLHNRGIYLCRGKVLGGSSCANVLLYHRGSSADYDQWAELTGDDEWSALNVLPYFKMSEHHHKGPAEFHGVGGEYSVSDVRYQNPLSKTFLDACEESGLPYNSDFNNWSHGQEGYGRYEVNEHNGARSSAASGFFDPVKSRKNLKVLSSTQVNKICIENSCAVGIEIGNGDLLSLKEGGEVLLTAGAIGSPHLLKLSGVGPKEELAKHSIECKADLPGVGANMQDHPAAIVSYKCSEGNEGVSVTSKIRIKGTTMTNPKVIMQWLLRRRGPLTSTGCDHGAFLKTNVDLQSPDLQMRFIAAQSLTADGMGTYTKFRESAKLGDGFSVQSIAVRPASRGSIKLRSNDPRDKPLIETGYLSDEGKKDLATVRAGLKKSREIAKAACFDKYRGEEVFPGPHVQTDEQLDQYIRESLHTSNAIVGTCKMGQASDNMAVVDPKLRVKGVKGLRVIDSSVMPIIPGGQTGAPTIMIAEKAARFIKSGN